MVITRSLPSIKMDDNKSISLIINGGVNIWCLSTIEIIIHNMITQSCLSDGWLGQPIKIGPDICWLDGLRMVMLMVGSNQNLQRWPKPTEKKSGAKLITRSYLKK